MEERKMQIKAAVADKPGKKLKIKDVELDAPKSNEVLVKIVATGICHTDKAAIDGATTPLPAVLGHEGAGIVEQVGSEVTKVKVGDHVALSFSYCGECRNCRAGHPGMCIKFNRLNFEGSNFDGTHRIHNSNQNLSTFFGQSSFANYVVAAENNVVKVPDNMDLRLVGPLGCGIQTGAGTVLNYIKLQKTDSIVIFGMGPVGLSAVMAAKITGAKHIIAIDLNDNKLAMAKEMGATTIINSRTDDAASKISELIPEGADYTLDTTGNAGVIKQAVHLLRPAGECVLIGIGGNVEFNIMQDLLAESKKIAGVVEGDSIPQEFIPQLIKYYQEGKFSFDRLIKLYEFNDINQAFEDFENNKTMKPVVVMDSDYHNECSTNSKKQTITSGKKNLLLNSDLLGKQIYDAEYIHQSNIEMKIDEVIIPAGTRFSWKDHHNNLIMVILDGKLLVNTKGSYSKGTTIVAPAGQKTNFIIDSENAAHALVMIRKATKKLGKPIIVKNDDKVWESYCENGHIHLYLKNLLTPDEIGGCLMLLDYPADHITEWHDHPFTHAAYIIDGVFVNESQFDEKEKYYGPGAFVCGPKGQVMRHGAAKEQNCHCYFFTDEPFSLHYLNEEKVQSAKKQR